MNKVLNGGWRKHWGTLEKCMQSSEPYHDDCEKMEERSHCHSLHFHCARSLISGPLKVHREARSSRKDSHHTQQESHTEHIEITKNFP